MSNVLEIPQNLVTFDYSVTTGSRVFGETGSHYVRGGRCNTDTIRRKLQKSYGPQYTITQVVITSMGADRTEFPKPTPRTVTLPKFARIFKTTEPTIGYTEVTKGYWSFLDLCDPDDPSQIGGHYPNKTMLLADLPNFLKQRGF